MPNNNAGSDLIKTGSQGQAQSQANLSDHLSAPQAQSKQFWEVPRIEEFSSTLTAERGKEGVCGLFPSGIVDAKHQATKEKKKSEQCFYRTNTRPSLRRRQPSVDRWKTKAKRLIMTRSSRATLVTRWSGGSRTPATQPEGGLARRPAAGAECDRGGAQSIKRRQRHPFPCHAITFSGGRLLAVCSGVVVVLLSLISSPLNLNLRSVLPIRFPHPSHHTNHTYLSNRQDDLISADVNPGASRRGYGRIRDHGSRRLHVAP